MNIRDFTCTDRWAM